MLGLDQVVPLAVVIILLSVGVGVVPGQAKEKELHPKIVRRLPRVARLIVVAVVIGWLSPS